MYLEIKIGLITPDILGELSDKETFSSNSLVSSQGRVAVSQSLASDKHKLVNWAELIVVD